MRKRSYAMLVLLGMLSLNGCRSTSASTKDVEFPTGEVTWEPRPVSQSVDFKGPISDADKTATVTLETTIKQLEKVRVFSLQRVNESVTYNELVCPSVTTYGNGTSGNWYGYWDVSDPKSKAAALAKAIKGIGPARADAIARFTDQDWLSRYGRQPRSRTEFIAWINAIDDRFTNKDKYKDLRGIAAVVLDQYGEENMKNLGYAPRNQVDCHYEARTKWIETLKDTWSDSYRVLSTERKTTTVTVSVSGLKLLPGESEFVRVAFDGISSPTASADQRFHQLQKVGFDEASRTFRFKAERQLTPAPNNVDVRITKIGNQLKVDAFDNSFSQLQGYNAAGTVSISLTIKKDGNFWIFSPARKQDLSSMTLSGESGSQTFTLDGNFKAGNSIYVNYAIKRLGTSFYDGNAWSESRESARLTW